MVAKVGINGFGRIGRVVFRTCLENPKFKITAINDPAIDVEYICYLIKFDSTHGKFNGVVMHTANEIIVDGTRIKIFHEKLPSNVPWQTADVQYVVEACGMFTNIEKASGHLVSQSVKRVIITAPSVDVPMVILGVNHTKFTSEQKVISCASSTLYCLTPIIKILEDNYGVDEGFVTSIHAMTPSLKPLDGLCLRGKHWRDHRSILQNIIPATTGACKALGKIIPQVKDKLSGLAFRVPIANVSVLDLSIRLIKNTSLEDIVKVIDELKDSAMANLVKTSKDEAVSSDFIGDSHSCILDVNSSLQLKSNFFKLVCWYENEFSYACRVADTIMFFERQLYLLEPVSKMTYLRPRSSKKRDIVEQTELRSSAAKCSENDNKLENSNLSSPYPDNEFKPETIQPIILRNPLSNHISGSPLPFRVRNNDNEILKPALYQNIGSFHSCVEKNPKSMKQTTNFTTKQHLEKIKKEFTRIVSATEDLFKKSDSNKFQSSLCNKSKKRNKINSTKPNFSTELIIFRPEEIVQPYKRLLNNPLLKVSGDLESCIQNVKRNRPRSSNKQRMSSHKEAEKDISNNTTSDKEKGENGEILNLKSVAGFNWLDQQLNNDRQNNNIKVPNDSVLLPIPNAVFKKQVTNTITRNTLVDSLTQNTDMYQNKYIKNESNKPNMHGQKKINELEKSNKLHEILTDNDSGFTSPSIKCSSDIDDTSNPNIITDISKEFDNAKMKIETMGLKTENSQMKITNSYPTIVEHSADTSTVTDIHKDDNTSNLKTRNDVYPNKEIEVPKMLERLNKYILDPVVVVSDNRPKSTSTDKVINNGNNRKQDIYDKLDSASATDSDNSFQIKERKSQVIHITDLTNSLEDLVRLDKICRIIEISDELSDELFSTLDDGNGNENKKWSFKDLCERIKLDEFCNKLFGK